MKNLIIACILLLSIGDSFGQVEADFYLKDSTGGYVDDTTAFNGCGNITLPNAKEVFIFFATEQRIVRNMWKNDSTLAMTRQYNILSVETTEYGSVAHVYEIQEEKGVVNLTLAFRESTEADPNKVIIHYGSEYSRLQGDGIEFIFK